MDSCSINQTTPLHEACTLYQASAIVEMTYNAATAVTGSVQGVDHCEWIRQRISEPQSQLLLGPFGCV